MKEKIYTKSIKNIKKLKSKGLNIIKSNNNNKEVKSAAHNLVGRGRCCS